MKKFNKFREDSLLEVLKASDPTGKWIHDFVHSDNPKFAGKSKKERIRMALGAAYAAKRNEEVVAEAKDSREYDYEGDMAKSQLRSIMVNAQRVHDMLEDDTNMAEWVQSKITLASDYISTVADYMQSEVKEEIENNHWYDAGVKDATRGARPNPRTYLPTLKDKQAKHPEEIHFYMNGYKSVKQGVAEGSSYKIDQDDHDEFTPDEIVRIKNSHFPDTLRDNLRAAKKEARRAKHFSSSSNGGDSNLGSPVGSASNNTHEGVAEGYGDGREYGGAYVKGRSDDARMTERITRQAKAAAKKAGKTFNTSAEYRLWHMKQQSKKRNVAEGHYEDADDYLSKANDADAKGDKLTYHHHMADYHDSLSQWHEDKGRSASADKHAEKADYHSNKYTELARGVKEEVEPIEELNKDTVYSYAKKAHKDQDNQSTITGKAYLANDPKTANKAHHKFTMRAAGLDRAEKRLNKEDIEIAEAHMSAAQRLWNAEQKQRAKSDASLARTPSSIPKPEEKK